MHNMPASALPGLYTLSRSRQSKDTGTNTTPTKDVAQGILVIMDNTVIFLVSLILQFLTT